jgi:hypothetical protein
VDDSGKTVTKSLSGTGLSDTDDVATREGHWPALGLNGRGLSEASGLDLVEHIGGESGLFESLDRSGDVGTSQGHGVVGAEFVDLCLRTSGNDRVLLVERLLELGHGAHVPLLLLEVGAELAHPVAATEAAAAAATATTGATSVATVATTVAVATVISVMESQYE